jgi:hypothetical protein
MLSPWGARIWLAMCAAILLAICMDWLPHWGRHTVTIEAKDCPWVRITADAVYCTKNPK